MVRRSAKLAKLSTTPRGLLFKRACEVGVGLILMCGTACGSDEGSSTAPGSPAKSEASGSATPAQANEAKAAATDAPKAADEKTTAAGAAGAAAAPGAEPAQTAMPGMAAMPAMSAGGATNTSGAMQGAHGNQPGAANKPTTSTECGLKTSYPGDDYCINAPAADKGWQLHIGPEDYDNVDPKYILKPGEERTDNFTTTSTNDVKKYFYYRQFRMRPGAHHNIITASGAGDTTMRADTGGRRIGTTNHLLEDNPLGGVIAPENKGVGIPLEPQSRVSVSLHSINTTDQPLLREIWVNFWYRPDEEVTEPVQEMFQAGDVAFQVQPKEDKILGPYKCNIEGDGRMLWFYGHRHANNVRFSAWRVRDGKKDLFYEGLNWEEPMVLEYSSTVMNPVPDRAKMIEGGWSGVLDMKTGDTIEWECHIVNQTDQVLRFTNNTYTGEMCIMDAELVNANCPSGRGGLAP